MIRVAKKPKQTKVSQGVFASVFLSHLKKGKCYRRKGKVIRRLVKISFDPDKISLVGKWVFAQNMYQILVP